MRYTFICIPFGDVSSITVYSSEWMSEGYQILYGRFLELFRVVVKVVLWLLTWIDLFCLQLIMGAIMEVLRIKDENIFHFFVFS